MDTLGFGYILPTAGRIRDFHPLERALAGRTEKMGLHVVLTHSPIGLASAVALAIFSFLESV
jgi:hypothetical protein